MGRGSKRARSQAGGAAAGAHAAGQTQASDAAAKGAALLEIGNTGGVTKKHSKPGTAFDDCGGASEARATQPKKRVLITEGEEDDASPAPADSAQDAPVPTNDFKDFALPIAVLQAVVATVSQQDLQSVRLVCKYWAQYAAEGVANLITTIRPPVASSTAAATLAARSVAGQMPPEATMASRMSTAARLCPCVHTLTVLVPGRTMLSTFNSFIDLLQSFKSLRHLTLEFSYAGANATMMTHMPNREMGYLGSKLTGLRSLTVRGMVLPSENSFHNWLVRLRHLESLTWEHRSKASPPFRLHVAHPDLEQPQGVTSELLDTMRTSITNSNALDAAAKIQAERAAVAAAGGSSASAGPGPSSAAAAAAATAPAGGGRRRSQRRAAAAAAGKKGQDQTPPTHPDSKSAILPASHPLPPGNMLPSLPPAGHNLRHLSLFLGYRGSNVDPAPVVDLSLAALLAALPNLASLEITGVPLTGLGDESLKAVAKLCAGDSLKRVNAAFYSTSPLSNIPRLADGLKRLEELRIDLVHRDAARTMNDLRFIATKLPNVKGLALKDPGGLGQVPPLWPLLAGMTGLESLKIKSLLAMPVRPGMEGALGSDEGAIDAHDDGIGAAGGSGGNSGPWVDHLSCLTGLTSLELLEALPAQQHWSGARKHLPIDRLLPNLPKLRCLTLDCFTSDELKYDSLRAVSSCKHLTSLTVHLADTSQQRIQASLDWFPPCLAALSLRHADLACPAHHSRQAGSLTSLSLSACTLGCRNHLRAALDALAPSLIHLELDMLPQLRHAQLAALAGLTRLTSLGIAAMGNCNVQSCSLPFVSTLTGLRALRWHAGDLLDYPIDPVALQSLRRLQVLGLPANMYYRMSRWHATDILEQLPCCEVDMSGVAVV